MILDFKFKTFVFGLHINGEALITAIKWGKIPQSAIFFFDEKWQPSISIN